MKVDIPISKSHYARIAMICAIAGIDIPYCDENDDIVAIREALSIGKNPIEWDKNHIWVGGSGTATRFSIAYYATQERQVIIDGSEQMQKRPISSIIEAVKSLGAEVIGESLPITIKGCRELKKSVEVDSSQSSQTISALMLIGMKNGLKITTRGKRNSWSYVELTAEVMRQFGIKVEIEEKNNYADITVHPMKDIRFLKAENIEIKKDWSSAVFWYGWCATRGEEIEIEGLKRGSCQPDEAAVDIFERIGVVTEEIPDRIRLRYNEANDNTIFELDCRKTPDLAMVLIPTLCKLERKFKVTGLDTLDGKESRRGSCLCRELRKAGYAVEWNETSMSWNGEHGIINGKTEVYNDHRMVMAMIILGAEGIDYEPLKKSYPKLIQLGIDKINANRV